MSMVVERERSERLDNDLHHQRPTRVCRVSAAALLAVW
jgi:hypothetical protein